MEFSGLDRQLALVELHAKVPRFQNVFGVLRQRSSAQGGAYASEQFVNSEWLRDVIIGAGIKCLNLGAFFTLHREHDDRNFR